MDVFLLRHGCAEPLASRDRDRKLNAQGKAELHSVLKACREDLALISKMFVSPYVRTQETADLAMEYFPNLSPENRHLAEFLTPGFNPSKVIEWLEQRESNDGIILVTHQPLVGTLLDELCGFETGQYRMGTAALARLNIPLVARGLADLVWIKQP